MNKQINQENENWNNVIVKNNYVLQNKEHDNKNSELET